MPEIYFQLSINDQQQLLNEAANKLRIKPYLIEKDIWICWALNEIFTLPAKMAFKGGTSLSKGYNLINRFSEDIDVTIDYREFMPDLEIQTLSKSALSRKRDQLKIEVKNYVENTILVKLKERYNEIFDHELNYQLEANGENLFINYPSACPKIGKYVKKQILLEFGGANKTEPNESLEINTLLSAALSNLILPVAKSITTLSPIRTFWEKATLIHVECYRNRLMDNHHRLSRHWYDLAKLATSDVGIQALTDQSTFRDVLDVKKAFFNSSYANYDKCHNRQFKLIPNSDELGVLKSDYEKMIESGMFYSTPQPFEDLISELETLVEKINQGSIQDYN